jgi:septal ring factor EnvC (AmiA/AmiB activator)
MTAQVLFNPLTYIDRLTRGGFSQEQARASAEALETAFTEGVATKSDIAEVRAEIAATESRLRAEIASSESRLRAEIAGVRTEIAGVRTEIAQSKNDTLRWVLTFILALVGAVFAIVKFVH